MIRSMTAYAQHETKGELGVIIWEIRSVNQRYLEIYIRIPEQFRSIEPMIRDRIRQRLMRGKIECNLRLDLDLNMQDQLIINEILIKQLFQALNWIKNQSSENFLAINPVDILNWPGVILAKHSDLDKFKKQILNELDNALNNLIIARETEGAVLKKLIKQRLINVSKETNKIRIQMPEILKWQHNKMMNKLKETQILFDNNRIEQELILMAQRIDIAEELDRLDSHVQETLRIIETKNTDAVGRRLDFMMQEFNRESNTLASKSINSNVTMSAVELKILIEQMREQIQNIE